MGARGPDWWQFSGKERDFAAYSEFEFRHYDATIGRFMSVDPLADAFTFVNPFNYADNNPVTMLDLYGLQKIPASGGNAVQAGPSVSSGVSSGGSFWGSLGAGILSSGFSFATGALSQHTPTAIPLVQGTPIVFNFATPAINNTVLKPANPCQSCQEQISGFYENQARYDKFIQQGQERDPFVFGGKGMGMGFARTMGETIKQAPYVILPEMAGAKLQTLLWKLTPKLINASEGVTGLKIGIKGETTIAYTDGTFDVIDWSGYPNYAVPKPIGPFRDIRGTTEYINALHEKNTANSLIRSKGFTNFEVDVHEIHPVYLSGSPTSNSNKLIINRLLHQKTVTPWWLKKATEAKRLHETMLRF